MLQLVGIYLQTINSYDVTQKDIMTAMCADRVLMDLLSQCSSGDKPNTIEESHPKMDATLTYDQLVKDLIEHEKSYIRELNMISKVRELWAKTFKTKQKTKQTQTKVG